MIQLCISYGPSRLIIFLCSLSNLLSIHGLFFVFSNFLSAYKQHWVVSLLPRVGFAFAAGTDLGDFGDLNLQGDPRVLCFVVWGVFCARISSSGG